MEDSFYFLKQRVANHDTWNRIQEHFFEKLADNFITCSEHDFKKLTETPPCLPYSPRVLIFFRYLIAEIKNLLHYS